MELVPNPQLAKYMRISSFGQNKNKSFLNMFCDNLSAVAFCQFLYKFQTNKIMYIISSVLILINVIKKNNSRQSRAKWIENAISMFKKQYKKTL